MIKKLILCRHAQAEPALMGKSDFSRKLTQLGEEQATAAGNKLAASLSEIDLLVTSPAERAKITAALLAQQIGHLPVIEEKQIYEANTAALLRVVNALPDSANTVVLVGHNPGLSELARYLTGIRFDLDTAEMVRIEFEVGSWKLVSGNSGRVTA